MRKSFARQRTAVGAAWPGGRTARTLVAMAFAVSVVAADVAPVLAQETSTSQVFDNGRLRFGGGGHGTTTHATREASIDGYGNLRQPHYWSSDAGSWFKLTYSGYPLDIAIGTGTGGTNWTGSTVAENPALAGQVIDATGFVTTSTEGGADVGHGLLRSAGTATINGVPLEVSNTYELGASAAFVRITTRVANPAGSAVDNVNLWVGTRDDWVGSSDGPTKTRGNLEDGSFVQVPDTATPASALRITSAAEGVLFYSTTAGTNTAIDWCCSFANAYDTVPTSSPVQATGDGSYALHLPVGSLDPGAAAEIVWYYAAGSLADLDAVTREVADAAAPAVPAVDVGDGEVTLSWDEPASQDPITDYVVRYTSDDGATWTELRRGSVAAPLTMTIRDLDNGTGYRFEVAAVTGTGETEVVGAWSPTSSVVIPGSPSNTTAPAIAGDAVVGAVLDVEDPDEHWMNNGAEPMVASYRWQVDGADVTDATGSSFVVGADHVGSRVGVLATRTNEVASTTVAAPVTAVVPETSLLDALVASEGTVTPAFSPTVHSYDLQVGAGAASVTLTPTAHESAANVTVDGTAVVSGEGVVVPLEVGVNTVTIRVSVAPRVSQYTVTVSRPRAASSGGGSPARPGVPELVLSDEGALPPVGVAHATVGGRPVPVTVTRARTGEVHVVGSDFRLEVSHGDATDAAELAQPLRLAVGRQVGVSVEGFAPRSDVTVWLFSEPRLLGELTTDAAGRLEGTTAAIGRDVTACQHTLHAEGLLPGGERVSLSLGVWVDAVPGPYDDVASDGPHAAAIACLTDLGLLRGVGGRSFGPAGPLTRGQAASLLARRLGLVGDDLEGSEAGHARAIEAVVEVGLAVGFPDGSFGAAVPVTRGQLATMLAAAAGLRSEGTPPFHDVAGTAHAGAVAVLADRGIVTGTGDGSFRPNAPVTRGQAASMLLRASGLLG